MPISSIVRRSASRICAALRTRIALRDLYRDGSGDERTADSAPLRAGSHRRYARSMAATVNVNGRIFDQRARGHLGLRSRLPVRRGRLRDAADLQRRAVPVRPPHAPAARVGRRCSRCRCRSPTPRSPRRFRETMPRPASAGRARGVHPHPGHARHRRAHLRSRRPARRRRSSSSSSRRSIRRPSVYEHGVTVALVDDRPQPSRLGEPDDQVEQPAEQRAGDAGGVQARRVRRRDAELPRRAGRVHDSRTSSSSRTARR